MDKLVYESRTTYRRQAEHSVRPVVRIVDRVRIHDVVCITGSVAVAGNLDQTISGDYNKLEECSSYHIYY